MNSVAHSQYTHTKKGQGFNTQQIEKALQDHGFVSQESVDTSYARLLSLVSYISQAQKKGFTQSQITPKLVNAGWKTQDIHQAFLISNTMRKPVVVESSQSNKKKPSQKQKIDTQLQEIDSQVESQLQKTSSLLSQLRQNDQKKLLSKIKSRLANKKHFFSDIKKSKNSQEGTFEKDTEELEKLKKQISLEKKKNQLTNKQFEQLQQVIEGLNSSLSLQSSLQMQQQVLRQSQPVPQQPVPQQQQPYINISTADSSQQQQQQQQEQKVQQTQEPLTSSPKKVQEQKEDEQEEQVTNEQNKKVVQLSSEYKNPTLQVKTDSISVSASKSGKKEKHDLSSLEQRFQNMSHSSGAGFGFYNQVVPEEISYAQEPVGDRAQTGIPDLDLVIDGGLVRNSQTLVSGGPGTGKSTFGLQFLINGIVLYNEPGVYVTFEQTREAIIALGKQFGWDIENLEKQNMLIIHEYTPEQVHKALKSGGGSFRDLIDSIHAKRIVIDSITEYLMLFDSEMSQRKEITDFYKLLNRWGCTGVVVGEEDSNEVTKKATVLDYESDAVILLYNERKGDIRQRGLEIFKMRGTKHAGRIFPLRVTDTGVIVDVKSSQIYRA